MMKIHIRPMSGLPSLACTPLLGVGLSLVVALVGCGSAPKRFPLAPPRWEDTDRKNVEEAPKEYYSGMLADVADKNFLRPIALAPYVPLGQRALNVNALDEVPNSSWFQNRIGYFDYTEEELARAACGDTPSLSAERDEEGTWEIVAAKPNGAYPGFFIKNGDQRYLLKFDGPVQPGRATSSDVIGSKIYWAVGYHVPCNEVVYFDRKVLSIAEGATAEDEYGRKKPITQQDIERVLEKAYRTKDGRLRASASRFLPGRPLGPFSYEGRRADDPNDHVPHQHRRELRGNRLLSAWLHHHDAREQNTLDVWLTDQGGTKRSFIRHYMIDFGDCLGSRWAFDPVSKRFGYSYFVDYDQVAVDLMTFGAYPRPWHDLKINPEFEIFGYFNVKDFEPASWVPEYPNPAFSEMRYDDALWMARILARFTEDQLRAIVETAHLENEAAEDYLVETLLGRRRAILEEYFTQYAPLTDFRFVRFDDDDPHQSLCFVDLAVKHQIVDPKKVFYKVRFYGGKLLDQELGWMQLAPDETHPDRTCVQRSIGDSRPADLVSPRARDDHPLRYGLIKIWIHQQADIYPTSAVFVHIYDLGPGKGYEIVGIEHPNTPVLPELY